MGGTSSDSETSQRSAPAPGAMCVKVYIKDGKICNKVDDQEDGASWRGLESAFVYEFGHHLALISSQ